MNFKKIGAGVGVLVLLFWSFLNYSKSSPDIGEKVIEVVDGDTFFIENKQPIRLFGIDAPDLKYCYGQEAKEKLEKLIGNKKVVLKEPRTDKFGRILALVYIDGALVNEGMIQSGMALYLRQGESQTERLKKANEYARKNNLGIFSPLCYQTENPKNPKCNIKGNIGASQEKRYYHLPGCSNYDQVIVEKNLGEEWFCSEKEAIKAGFKKAKSCY